MKKKMIQSLVLVKNMVISKKPKIYTTLLVSLKAKNKDMVLKKNLKNDPLKFLQSKTVQLKKEQIKYSLEVGSLNLVENLK